MLRDSRVLQAARDGGSGGGASGAGLKADARRRPTSHPHDSDSDEDGEWEPGAYGLVDVPQKRSLYRPPAWMSGSTGGVAPARSGLPAGAPSRRPTQNSSPALPPTPSRNTAREAAVPSGGASLARRSNSSAGGRAPHGDPQQHPGALPFAFVSRVPSRNDSPQLRLFPGQLRAQSSKRLGSAAAPGALLVQRSDSNSSRASSHSGDHTLVERCDSAAFGSEISFKGDE